jgi:hypothetical protein
MSKAKLGQEPAFPIEEMQKNVNDSGVSQMVPHLGMSKRFYAACMAMQGLLASNNTEYLVNGHNEGFHEPVFICKTAYEFADELLKEENR